MARRKSPNAYRNIREASEELELEAHVLRFWETRFSMLQPMTRGGGRRFYSPDDLKLLRVIKTLLHDEGNTIKATNRLISEEGVDALYAQYCDGSAPVKDSAQETSQPVAQEAKAPAPTSTPQAANDPSPSLSDSAAKALASFEKQVDALIAQAQRDIAALNQMLAKL